MGKILKGFYNYSWEARLLSLYDQAQAIPGRLHHIVPGVSLKPADWNKIQAHTQKSDETVHDYYNQLHIIFKENSDILLDVDFTQVAFNTMFVNGLNWAFSLLVTRIRMDLANVSNQLSPTPNESPQRKTAKILNFQPQQKKALK